MDDKIELSNLSKALEFEKQSREIDKMTLMLLMNFGFTLKIIDVNFR